MRSTSSARPTTRRSSVSPAPGSWNNLKLPGDTVPAAPSLSTKRRARRHVAARRLDRHDARRQFRRRLDPGRHGHRPATMTNQNIYYRVYHEHVDTAGPKVADVDRRPTVRSSTRTSRIHHDRRIAAHRHLLRRADVRQRDAHRRRGDQSGQLRPAAQRRRRSTAPSSRSTTE